MVLTLVAFENHYSLVTSVAKRSQNMAKCVRMIPLQVAKGAWKQIVRFQSNFGKAEGMVGVYVVCLNEVCNFVVLSK